MTGQNSMNNKRNRTGSTSLNSKKQRNSGQSSVTNKVNKSGTRARWTPESKRMFLEILLCWCNGGTNNKAYIPSRIDDSTWENITNDLKARCPSLIFEKQHVKQLHRDLKKKVSDSSKNRTPVACQIHPNCSCVQIHSNLCTDPSNHLNCLLHEVYGARGASENHQGPSSSSADPSSSDNALTDNQHGGESSFGNHQLPGSSSAIPPISLQTQANFSGHVSNNIAGTSSAVLNSSGSSIPSLRKCISEVDRLLQTNQPHERSEWDEWDELDAGEIFKRLLQTNQPNGRSEWDELDAGEIFKGLPQTNQPHGWDEWDAGEIFKDEHHCELFLSMDEIQRINWLWHKINERRKQRLEESESA